MVVRLRGVLGAAARDAVAAARGEGWTSWHRLSRRRKGPVVRRPTGPCTLRSSGREWRAAAGDRRVLAAFRQRLRHRLDAGHLRCVGRFAADGELRLSGDGPGASEARGHSVPGVRRQHHGRSGVILHGRHAAGRAQRVSGSSPARSGVTLLDTEHAGHQCRYAGRRGVGGGRAVQHHPWCNPSTTEFVRSPGAGVPSSSMSIGCSSTDPAPGCNICRVWGATDCIRRSRASV